MANPPVHKREYFRVDTFLPLKVNLVPPLMREDLKSSVGDFHHLKPAIVNISGGGVSFKSSVEYRKGDILEILLTLPVPSPLTLCVYGEVLRTDKTAEHFQLFISFTVISEKIREIIISFVFQWEREILRNTQQAAYTGLNPLFVHRLIDNTNIPFDIFVREQNEMKYLFAAGLPFDSATKEFFAERDITKIFVSEDDMELLNEYQSKTRVKAPVFDRDSITLFKEYSFNKKSHHHIDKTLLVPRTEINFSLYAMNDFSLSTIIEVPPTLPVLVDEAIISAPGDILIKKTDISLYRDYLDRLSASGMAVLVEHMQERLLKERAKLIMDLLLMEPSNRELMKDTIAIAQNIVGCIMGNTDSVYPLLSLKGNDLYPYTHSVHVAVLSVAVAVAGGLKAGTIERLAIGALLHDIGHSVINDEITNKQGRLSDTQYEVMKTHVVEGAKILKGHGNIHEDSLKAVLHHHEKFSGRGFLST